MTFISAWRKRQTLGSPGTAPSRPEREQTPGGLRAGLNPVALTNRDDKKWSLGFETAYMRGSRLRGLGADYEDGFTAGSRARDKDDEERNNDGTDNEDRVV